VLVLISVSAGCYAIVLQVKMAEDIDFKYPTRKACAWEISNFCKNIPHGHARVIRCLQVSCGQDMVQAACMRACSRQCKASARLLRMPLQYVPYPVRWRAAPVTVQSQLQSPSILFQC
jgi:hypothetical protein